MDERAQVYQHLNHFRNDLVILYGGTALESVLVSEAEYDASSALGQLMKLVWHLVAKVEGSPWQAL